MLSNVNSHYGREEASQKASHRLLHFLTSSPYLITPLTPLYSIIFLSHSWIIPRSYSRPTSVLKPINNTTGTLRLDSTREQSRSTKIRRNFSIKTNLTKCRHF